MTTNEARLLQPIVLLFFSRPNPQPVNKPKALVGIGVYEDAGNKIVAKRIDLKNLREI
jgi:hypothetical protein